VSTASGASILTPYNVIVNGYFVDTASDICGGLAAEGTVTLGPGGSSYNVGDDLNGEPISAFPLTNSTNGKFTNTGTPFVTVGGVTSTTIGTTTYPTDTAKPNAGNYFATGSIDASADSTGAVTSTNPVNFTTAFTQFGSQAGTWGAMAQTSGDSVANANNVTTITITNPGANYVTVTTTQLAADEIEFVGVSSTSWVIVNVAGSSVTLEPAWGTYFCTSAGTNCGQEAGDGATGAEDVLYNFYQATSVTMADTVVGSVLAPGAAATDTGAQFDGSLVAASFLGSVEFHNLPFMGGATPEPAPVACVGLGLLALAYFRKRRRA
jgi:choice-of-anchor A domain-containing protein